MEFARLSDTEVTGYNRGAILGSAEITGTCTAQDWTVSPPYTWDVRMYSAPNGVLTAKTQEEVDIIIFSELKLSSQQQVKTDCQGHIYAAYPAPIQQSMSLGIYPSEQCDAMILFIAECIEEEDRVNDLIAAALNQDELDAATPIWPEA